MSKVTLTQPVKKDTGEEITEINLDFSTVKGLDLFKAINQWKAKGNTAAMPTIDFDFVMYFAAYIADVPQNLFDVMEVPDVQEIYMKTFSFLNKTAAGKQQA